MRYLSVFSGMEAATVAWHPLGWKPVGFSEIEPFACAVLAHRFPNTPNYGDITKHAEWPIEPGAIDLLVGGSPCQAFSVAGLRKGLADPRGNLALVFLGLADRLKPKWIVWENVPGVLSSGGGRDLGSFLGALVQLGYGFAYRVLDAQHFGVPQRRRRIFLVACLGDWKAPAKVLLEPESLCWDSPKSRKKGKEASGNPGQSIENGRILWSAGDQVNAERVVDKAGTLHCNHGLRGGFICPIHYMPGTVAPTIGASGPPYSRTGNERVEAEALAISFQPGNLRRDAGAEPSFETTTTLKATMGDQMPHVAIPPMAVRRLTPMECERLQGFPDNWSRIPWLGKSEEDCPDCPRYKCCGNSMAVPVMRWIGEQIARVESYGKES